MLFFAYFWCSVVTSVTFSINNSKFEEKKLTEFKKINKNKKPQKKNPKNSLKRQKLENIKKKIKTRKSEQI